MNGTHNGGGAKAYLNQDDVVSLTMEVIKDSGYISESNPTLDELLARYNRFLGTKTVTSTALRRILKKVNMLQHVKKPPTASGLPYPFTANVVYRINALARVVQRIASANGIHAGEIDWDTSKSLAPSKGE